MNNSNDSGGMMSEINVTPLVDVMLVLLTVFIVTAPLMMNAVSVNLPKVAPTNSLDVAHDAKLSIDASGQISLDQTPIDQDTLEAALKQRNSAGDLQVEIMADETVAYKQVAQVMSHIQRAGVDQFTFVMLPETSSDTH
jgi:biopolymer transport protein ExbD